MNWKYVKPLKNKSAVQTFMKKYDLELPDEAVFVMETYNGGRPANKEIVTETGRVYVFKSMLSYNEDDPETIYNLYPERFSGMDLFPLGSDSAGNFICFDLTEKRYVLLNHETDEKETITVLPFLEEVDNNQAKR